MGIKILAQRFKHTAPPLPEGCRWCGVPIHDHAQLWVPSKKWHRHTVPTRAQIIARKKAWNKIKGYSK